MQVSRTTLFTPAALDPAIKEQQNKYPSTGTWGKAMCVTEVGNGSLVTTS